MEYISRIIPASLSEIGQMEHFNLVVLCITVAFVAVVWKLPQIIKYWKLPAIIKALNKIEKNNE